jgi:hypothetical protein
MKVFQNGKLFAEIFFIKKLNLAFHAKFKSQELRVGSANSITSISLKTP